MSRKLLKNLLGIALLLTFTSCNEKPLASPTDEAKGVFLSALAALEKGDIDTYLSHADFGNASLGNAADSAMRQVLSLHIQAMQAEQPAVADIAVVDATMQGDSTCTVLYQYTYADSTTAVMSQKMVRTGGEWRLKLRE